MYGSLYVTLRQGKAKYPVTAEMRTKFNVRLVSANASRMTPGKQFLIWHTWVIVMAALQNAQSCLLSRRFWAFQRDLALALVPHGKFEIACFVLLPGSKCGWMLSRTTWENSICQFLSDDAIWPLCGDRSLWWNRLHHSVVQYGSVLSIGTYLYEPDRHRLWNNCSTNRFILDRFRRFLKLIQLVMVHSWWH